MKKLVLILAFLPFLGFSQNLFNKGKQEVEKDPTELNINENVQGTLWIPEGVSNPPLLILLTGSGPNDRDGNSVMTKNDGHKQLALALKEQGIATYRYDKRVVTQIKNKKVDPNTTFEDFITDARAVVAHFEKDNRFSKLYIAGHSQGSLVGMLAVNENVDGFISLAGAGEPIDNVIVSQIAAQSPGLDTIARATFDKMRNQKEVVEDVNPYLMQLQGPQIQPFMKSWMAYHPAVEIAKLKTPVLIINGDRDFQVAVAQANMLHEALPSSQLEIIEGLNHVLKKVGKDDIEAAKSYTDVNFPIHPELIEKMVAFMK
ncbi:MAG: alpha/beta hydrolase [Nonlabens sp.]|uniref:alpha/beta hydrolase n=1 Tax=Nonlabens sp. TaxID=1888209 RepID=UPI003EF8CE72